MPLIVKPGDIILFKEYSLLQKLINILFNRKTLYNKYFLIPETGYFDSNKSFLVYRLKTPFTQSEMRIFKSNYKSFVSHNMFYNDIYSIMNIIRPNMFSSFDFTPDSIRNNKSYKLLYNNAKEERRQINIHSLWK